MKINHQIPVFDAADIATESNFWAGVLGGTVDAERDFHMVFVDGAPRIGIQLAPDHMSPQWPNGATQQQVHLDVWVDDIASAHQEVMRHGATLLKESDDTDSPDNFQVYADPAGHPFCLCWVNKK